MNTNGGISYKEYLNLPFYERQIIIKEVNANIQENK